MNKSNSLPPFKVNFEIEADLLGSCGYRCLLPWIEPRVFRALFDHRDSRIVLGGSGSLEAKKSKRIYAKEGVLIVALCCPLVFLWWSPLCLFWANPQPLIDAFFEISTGINYCGKYFERRFGSQPFPPLLAKFYPLDMRDMSACFCTCTYGQCQK